MTTRAHCCHVTRDTTAMSEARVPCSPGEEVREVAASGDTGLMLQLLDGGAPFILDMVRHKYR